MATGTYIPGETKERPGIYFSLVAQAQARVSRGTRGRVALPVRSDWGPDGFQVITDERQIASLYWNARTGNTVRLLSLAWRKGPSQLVAYRLTGASGAKATATVQDTAGSPANVVTLTAKYNGARPNTGVGDWKAVIATNIDDAAKKDLKLYEGSVLLATWTFSGSPADLVAQITADGKGYLAATKLADGSGIVANTAGRTFSGGDSGLSPTNQQYLDWLGALEAYKAFDVLSLDGVGDTTLQDSVITWLSRVRTEGLFVQAAMGHASDSAPSTAATRAQGINNRAVAYVASGGYLTDEATVYTPADAAVWVAAAMAVTPLNQSFCGAVTPFSAIGTRLTNGQIVDCLSKGALVFDEVNGQVIVEDDRNTFNSPTSEEDINWRNIQTSVIIDAVNTDLSIIEAQFKGKIPNTRQGRAAIVGSVLAYFRIMANATVLQPEFSCAEDPDTPSSGGDAYLVDGYTPVNAVKRIFNRIAVGS